jgi:L-alanine-DL-glutamate epimerase-like enolase superfamily enzyme
LAKVFALAAVRNVTVMPHTFYDGLGLLAAIHATAALGTAESMIEWRRFDLEATIYGDAFAPERGCVAVPKGPGLGLEPAANVLRDYRVN